ncbi:MAG: NUDIX hydrolase N-terminal domain-containing protein [Clostridium sp.]
MNNTLLNEPWLKWAIEIQSIAQCGLTYTKDNYDRERYEQLREISAEMLSYKTEIPVEKIKTLFCNEIGYQTPKLDTRGVIFKDDKILLVKENSGKWSLPGGWVDVLESIESNTIKEVFEEAGLIVKAKRVIAILDRKKHNLPPYPYGVCKVFVECEYISGEFVENIETTELGYFSLEDIPELAEEKNTLAQIEMCFKAKDKEDFKVIFD